MNENEKHEQKVEETVKWAERQVHPAPKPPDTPGVPDTTQPLEPEVVEPEQQAIPGSSVAPVFTNRVGRPTKFFPQYIEQAKVLASKGFTDLDLAEAFMVTEKTIYNWKDEIPEFLQATIDGKAMIDDEVEKSLLQAALGYSHPDEKVFCHEGDITVHKTVKHYPPNSNAASLWLRNRRPDVWRDKHEIDFKAPFSIKMDEDDVGTL